MKLDLAVVGSCHVFYWGFRYSLQYLPVLAANLIHEKNCQVTKICSFDKARCFHLGCFSSIMNKCDYSKPSGHFDSHLRIFGAGHRDFLDCSPTGSKFDWLFPSPQLKEKHLNISAISHPQLPHLSGNATRLTLAIRSIRQTMNFSRLHLSSISFSGLTT